ncbi:MAG: mechanosensitive ion channel family protein [Desulfomonilaceae bacterium]|nr:mechanosensitive ion channel family protein [Desulfomonilaceae bacterium]
MYLARSVHHLIPSALIRTIAVAIVTMAVPLGVCAAQPQPGTYDVTKLNGGSEASVQVKVEKSEASTSAGERETDAPSTQEVESEERPEDSKTEKAKPAEPISPVDTEAIDKATERISRKIDTHTWSASRWFGDWVARPVFNGITWLKLLISMFVFICVVITERVVRIFLDWRLARLKREGLELSWKGMLLSVVSKPLSALFWIYGAYTAFSLLFRHFDTPFGPNFIHHTAKGAANIGGAFAGIWLVYRLISVLDRYFLDKAEAPDSKVDHLLANVLGKTIRVIVVTIGGLVILQNVTGVNTAAILASLGIGGLAFALAAKEPLTNIFGTFTILADKPFRVGQWIKIDNYDGFVESVGYRSTRIRTWDGFLVTVPNQRILTSSLENMATRHFTRWKTTIKLPYGTPSEKLDRAVEIIRGSLENHERMHPDWPPRVYFTGFDNWTLNIFVSVWYNSTDWWAYYEWLHETCRRIKSELEKEGIALAVPPHALYMAHGDGFSVEHKVPDLPHGTPNRSSGGR